jgi:hypothetical protein
MISSFKDLQEIPEYVWDEIPENITKVLKAFRSALTTEDARISQLEKNCQIKSEPEEASPVHSQLKETEQKTLRKLFLSNNKLEIKVESLEATILGITQDIHKLKALTQSNSLELALEDLKKELKKEISSEYIEPFDYELKETYKTIKMIDQQLKIQTWNIEASLKEFNSRFEVHREKIVKIENIAQEFEKEVNIIIFKEISPIIKSIKDTQNEVIDLYFKFNSQAEHMMSDLNDTENSMQRLLDETKSEINKFRSDVDKSIKGLLGSNSLHTQKLELSISQALLDIENVKCEILISQKESYNTAKSDLIKSYKKDLAIIEDKLKWLPSALQDISGMSPSEARLYTIETRIKSEETSRINQINDIVRDIKYSKGLSMNAKGKKKDFKPEPKHFSTTRSFTPVPIITKVCKSPGGMSIVPSISKFRIRRTPEKFELLFSEKQ